MVRRFHENATPSSRSGTMLIYGQQCRSSGSGLEKELSRHAQEINREILLLGCNDDSRGASLTDTSMRAGILDEGERWWLEKERRSMPETPRDLKEELRLVG
jgi:hypothetical protein